MFTPYKIFLAMNMKVDSTCRNKIQFVCKANMVDKQPVEKDNRGDLLDCPTFYGKGWHNSNNEPGHGHHCFKVCRQFLTPTAKGVFRYSPIKLDGMKPNIDVSDNLAVIWSQFIANSLMKWFIPLLCKKLILLNIGLVRN